MADGRLEGKLEGKVALVTGAAGGIGVEVARRYVAEGAKVLLVDLDQAALDEAAGQIGSNAVATYAADVSRPEDNERMVAEAVERFGGLDVFVANAGIEGKVTPITEYSVEDFDRVQAVNVRGPFLGLKAAIPALQARGGGSVIITSSVAGVSGAPNLSAYSASKHAVIGLMRSAALECAAMNIRVNTVNPSPVETRMMRSLEEGLMPGQEAEAHAAFSARIPMGRYGEPQDIAALMTFLASDDAGFLTGGVYMADGGFTA